jgi:hypothetical protein
VEALEADIPFRTSNRPAGHHDRLCFVTDLRRLRRGANLARGVGASVELDDRDEVPQA